MGGGIFLRGWVLISVSLPSRSSVIPSFLPNPLLRFTVDWVLMLNIVIALVEYLTSEEAGQPLGQNFAWPVVRIVNCSAGSAPVVNGVALNGGVKKTLNGGVKENGNGNGHVNGYATGHSNGGLKTNGGIAYGKKTL